MAFLIMKSRRRPLRLLTFLLLCFCVTSQSQPSDDASTSSCTTSDDESVVIEYLKANGERKGSYRVQGWRWHTMAVIRELKLLGGMKSDAQATTKGIDYVVGFNMAGLQKIETDRLFPWLREKIDLVKDEKAKTALKRILRSCERQHDDIADMRRQSMAEIDRAHKSLPTMLATYEELFRLQNEIFAPMVARLVPEKEQEAFNFKVIRSLGIFDSRVFLVGMHQAVVESKQPEEMERFEQEIPSLPRYMLPRWKRLLYEPRTGGVFGATVENY